MHGLKWLGLEEWKAAVAKGETPEAAIRKAVIPDEIKAVEGEARALQFTISTGTVDRDRDTIDPEGWKLTAYKKNPVVLWAHDYSSPPIGRAKRIKVEDGRLISLAEFPAAEIHPFAEMIYQLTKGGFINATSVGFRPMKYLYNSERGGVDFAEQELLEFSIVPVPANPEALIEARGMGIDVEPMRKWAEGIIERLSDEPGLWMPKSQVEKALEVLARSPIVPVIVTLETAGRTSGDPAPEDQVPVEDRRAEGEALKLWLEDVEPEDFLDLAEETPEEKDTVTLDPAEFHAALAEIIGDEVRTALGRLRGRVD